MPGQVTGTSYGHPLAHCYLLYPFAVIYIAHQLITNCVLTYFSRSETVFPRFQLGQRLVPGAITPPFVTSLKFQHHLDSLTVGLAFTALFV